MTVSLRPVRFQSDAWRPLSTPAPSPPHALRVVTLNTWFSARDRPVRLIAQLARLRALDPDVIALQEVTTDLLDRLLATPWLRAAYAVPRQATLLLSASGYGTFLAIKPTVRSFSWHPYPLSSMGRGLLWAELTDGTRVGTVHLESLADYATERAHQLAASTRLLVGGSPALLMGDFNFDDREPDAPLLGPWVDLWPTIHPHDPGLTADSRTNPYRSLRGRVARRIDRVLLHDPTHAWRVEHLERIGTAAVAPGVFLSDHYGLVATLRRVSGAGA